MISCQEHSKCHFLLLLTPERSCCCFDCSLADALTMTFLFFMHTHWAKTETTAVSELLHVLKKEILIAAFIDSANTSFLSLLSLCSFSSNNDVLSLKEFWKNILHSYESDKQDNKEYKIIICCTSITSQASLWIHIIMQYIHSAAYLGL